MAPGNPRGCLLEPWPGPATRCGVVSEACILEAAALQEAATAAAAPAAGALAGRKAVFVGSLWKRDQVADFLKVVKRLRERYAISTSHYGWCSPEVCGGKGGGPGWAQENQFELYGPADAATAATELEGAFMSFDLRYSYHLEHEYVPDRWFKLAAMGKLVVTNSEAAAAIFGAGNVIAERDVELMVDRAVNLSLDHRKLSGALVHASRVVREHHTYSHRLRTLLTLFPS